MIQFGSVQVFIAIILGIHHCRHYCIHLCVSFHIRRNHLSIFIILSLIYHCTNSQTPIYIGHLTTLIMYLCFFALKYVCGSNKVIIKTYTVYQPSRTTVFYFSQIPQVHKKVRQSWEKFVMYNYKKNVLL